MRRKILNSSGGWFVLWMVYGGKKKKKKKNERKKKATPEACVSLHHRWVTKTSERTLGHLTQNTKTETQNKKILWKKK